MDQCHRALPEMLQPQQRQTNLAKKLHLLNTTSQESYKPQNVMPLKEIRTGCQAPGMFCTQIQQG